MVKHTLKLNKNKNKKRTCSNITRKSFYRCKLADELWILTNLFLGNDWIQMQDQNPWEDYTLILEGSFIPSAPRYGNSSATRKIIKI